MFLKYILIVVQSILSPITEEQLANQTAQEISFQVEIQDSTTSGVITNFADAYSDSVNRNNVLTFRQNHQRHPKIWQSDLNSLQEIAIEWSFKTAIDTTNVPNFGPWYGGTGWTGQPLFVEWSEEEVAKFKAQPMAQNSLTPMFSPREIIVGSLCGKVYFIDYKSGEMSRQPLEVGNPIKGTPSLDPAHNGNLYVGHGIPKTTPFGFSVFDLFSHKEVFRQGKDFNARRGWGAFDSSPIVVGEFLFWPGENGSLYKFNRQNGNITPHSILRYSINDNASLGTENSMAVWQNYGYFGDNGGHIICVNLSTMKPVWVYDNKDDIDATIVVDTTQNWPYIYVSSEVDKQGVEGFAHLTKLNAVTGAEVWQHKEVCYKKIFPGGKMLDGGIFGTPLLGAGDCKELIFVNFAANRKGYGGQIVAFDKTSGREVSRVPMNNYLWSSPVGITDKNGKMYLVTGDTAGNVFLIEALSGRILVEKSVGANFESSPIVVENSIIFGSRGNEIFKLSIR